VAALREAAKHQLFVYANSACLGKSVTYNTAWTAIPVAVSVVLVIACVVLFWKMVKPSFFPKAPKVSQ
jgi:RsiW-degrading membrane proteinase PrsW (M82 family)